MSTEPTARMITEHEATQVERANATTATPVVFVHGLWLLPSSWDRWLALFEETAREVRPPAAAERFIERACRVAESLELGVASANNVLLRKGERYLREA